MKIIILSILLMSSFSNAVQSVGKGGGYGEMQAIWINMKMPEFMQHCLARPSACSLNASEVALLQNALPHNFQLQIDQECKGQSIEVISRTEARIMSCDLYTENTHDYLQVKDISEIATLILAARLRSTSSISIDTAWDLAKKVFSSFSEENESAQVNLNSGPYLFHSLSAERHQQKSFLFTLEGHTTTLDITSHMLKSLGCDENNPLLSWQLTSASMRDLSSQMKEIAVIQLQSSWQCANSNPRSGKVQVYFAVDAKEILEDSVHTRVVGESFALN